MRTSKTQSIKSLLLQAWRERWSDVTWGIRIKSVLPRGVSGDVYDLADCILQQALVGPAPNSLFMSYLIHSLSSKIISYGSVLSSIGRYQSFYKPYCILSLLDLLKTFQSRIGCHGNEEECIALCKAVVSVTHWLYSCICHSITKLSELKQSPEHVSIIEKSYDALFYFSNSTFIKSLLHVGKFEDHVMYSQMLQKHQDLEEKLSQIPNVTNVSKEIIESILGLTSSVDNLPSDHISKNNEKSQFSASTLNIIVSIDAILNPANDVTTFVNQLLVVKKLQNFKLSQLYSEIIRASLIGIIDSSSTFEDALKWFAFTFLKLPNLIYKIHTVQAENEEDAFMKGLDMLLYNSRILNLTDLKSNFDSLQCLITEFCKVQVLTETQACNWVTQRQNEAFVPSHSNGIKSPTTKPSSQCGQASVPLILRAEHTLSTILKTLDADYAKVQQALLGVLCQILPLRNFKLMLAAAAATGKMHIFISKLIDCNEYNKYVASETVTASQIRALMFDVTFMLLFYTCQYYGVDVVVGHASNKDSFFIKWITDNLAENGKFKCPKLLLSRSDQTNTDMLLELFLNTEQEIKTHQIKWDEVCLNAPAAMQEILVAWEHGVLPTEKVKVLLDHIKSQFCFLPVCISAWLCNYINILHYEMRLKPMNMLQHFITPPVELVASPDESPSGSDRKTPQMPGMEQTTGHYVGRCKLMNGIVKLMMFHLHPPQQTQAKIAPVVPHGLTVKTPLLKILSELFSDMHCQGWVDVNSIHYFDTLLCVGGAQWFCDALVRLMLGYQSLHDINRAVDMIFGLFHLDIEQCALALLLHVIPFYLSSEVYPEKLAEPYTSALSRLAAITTYSALQSRQFSSNSRIKPGSKRSIHAVDIDTKDHSFELNKSSKIHRTNAELLEDTPFELQSLSDEQMHIAIDNPINKAIATLMRKLVTIASEDTISARSYFPIRFLEQIVLCAKDQASMILQFMPLGLVELLLKKYPEEFNHELVLAVSSMQSARARKVAALSLCHLTIAQNQLASRISQSWIEL